MSKRLDDRATWRLRALRRYVIAVDAGRLDEVASVLAQAETDPALARLLDELHAALADPEGEEIALTPAMSRDAEPLAAIIPALRIAREDPAARELIFESDAASVLIPTPARPRRRVGRLANALQAVAAVLVLGALLAGFFALNQSRLGHPGSAPPGQTTVTRSGLVPNAAQGVVAAGTWDGAVVALRPSDGKLYWRFVSGNGHPVTNVIVSGGVVYANTEYGDIYALRMSDGTLLWQRALGQFEGYPDQMMLTAGVVLATAADGLHTLRASDGASLWTSPRVPLLGAADGLVFVGTTRLGPAFPGSSVSNIDAGNIEALRAGDGKVLWTQPTAGRAAHSAAIAAGRVFVSLSGSDTIVEALGVMDGHLLWTQALPLGGGETVLAVDQRFLYLVGPRTCALAPGDGATLWCSKISLTGGVVETGGNIISFAVHNPQVPGSSRLGVVALHAADGGSAWTWNIPSASLPGPNNSLGISVGNYDPGLATGDDAIYVAPAGGVYALRASDGHLLWHSQPHDDVMSLATGA